MKDYYKIMGVPMTASDDQIRQVYRQKAKLLHPDLNNNNPQAAEKLVEINEAYSVLSDKEKRVEYLRAFQAYQQKKSGGQQGGQHSNQQGARQFSMEQITAAAYNQGYAKGYNDSTAKAAEKGTLHNQQIKALTDRLTASESEKAKLSRRIRELEDEVGELAAQNESLWIQVGENRDEANGANKLIVDEKLREETTKLVESLSAKIKHAAEEILGLKERIRAAEETVFRTEMENNRLTEENKTLLEQVASYEQYVNSRENADDLDEMVRERENMLKQVKKMIKNTYYGTLGVVYWAENEEIFKAYDKLKKRYETKLSKGEYKAKQKLAELENAYNTLIDEKARKSYNTTIDITDEDIEMERAEQKEYELAMQERLDAKAEDEFWAYVEELMFLAQTGDAESQNLLAEMYYYGDEIEQDLDQAYYWFKEAAKQQHPDALLNLGKCYLNGEGTLRDEQKGIGFIKQAAKLGNPEAAAFVSKTK